MPMLHPFSIRLFNRALRRVGLPALLLGVAACATAPASRNRYVDAPHKVPDESRMGSAELITSLTQEEVAARLEKALVGMGCSIVREPLADRTLRLRFERPALKGSVMIGAARGEAPRFRIKYTYRVQVAAFPATIEQSREVNAAADLLASVILDMKETTPATP